MQERPQENKNVLDTKVLELYVIHELSVENVLCVHEV